MCCDAVPGAGDTRMTKLLFMPQNSDNLLEWIVTSIWYDEGDDKDPTGAQIWVSNPLWCVVDCDRSHQSCVLFFLLLWSLSKGRSGSCRMRWIYSLIITIFLFSLLSPQQDKCFISRTQMLRLSFLTPPFTAMILKKSFHHSKSQFLQIGLSMFTLPPSRQYL